MQFILFKNNKMDRKGQYKIKNIFIIKLFKICRGFCEKFKIVFVHRSYDFFCWM